MHPLTTVPVIPRRQGASRAAQRIAMLTARVVALLLWPARMIEARRALATLAGLSDRELHDIGLTRQDLRDVTALPRDEDPTFLLGRIVSQRRRRPGRSGRDDVSCMD